MHKDGEEGPEDQAEDGEDGGSHGVMLADPLGRLVSR